MPPPSPETHPHLYREMCWKVEERGAVGETTLHVCVLLQVLAHPCETTVVIISLKVFPPMQFFLSHERVKHIFCSRGASSRPSQNASTTSTCPRSTTGRTPSTFPSSRRIPSWSSSSSTRASTSTGGATEPSFAPTTRNRTGETNSMLKRSWSL